MIKSYQKIYRVIIDSNPTNKIPMSIGQMKGDLIVFTDSGAPVRFPSGNAPGKVLTTDPTSATGWSLTDGGGSGSGASTGTLKNNTGSKILAGTVVCIDENGGEREIRKAKASDTKALFITAADCASGAEVPCYGVPNTICNVLCTSAAVTIGSKLCVSATAGICESSSTNGSVGIALSSKAAGSTGYVKVLLNCFTVSETEKTFTVSTTDLEDGKSSLKTDRFWYYYEE